MQIVAMLCDNPPEATPTLFSIQYTHTHTQNFHLINELPWEASSFIVSIVSVIGSRVYPLLYDTLSLKYFSINPIHNSHAR